MEYFVYVLESLIDNKLYIGQTSNLKDRIARHNGGRVPATKNRRPLKLIHSEVLASRSSAVKREGYLKNLKNPKYIKGAIMSGPIV